METAAQYEARVAKSRQGFDHNKDDALKWAVYEYLKGGKMSETIDRARIDALLAERRDRGGYERYLNRNAESLYILLNDEPEYRAKIAEGKGASVKAGLESNAKKLGMRVKVLETEDGEWIYVNQDLHESEV